MPNFPHPSFYFRRVEQLREVMVRNGDSAKQVWLLEFGWTSDTVHPNYAWFAVSETKKSANILRAFQYAQQNWRPWIGVRVHNALNTNNAVDVQRRLDAANFGATFNTRPRQIRLQLRFE